VQIVDLLRQNLKIPSCLCGKPVIEDNERALLHLTQMVGTNARHAEQAKLLCRLNSRMASEDSILIVDKDRNQKTKLVDGPCEFLDLLCGMDPRIMGVWQYLANWQIFNPKRIDGLRRRQNLSHR
jgi:hypothetical protein